MNGRELYSRLKDSGTVDKKGKFIGLVLTDLEKEAEAPVLRELKLKLELEGLKPREVLAKLDEAKQAPEFVQEVASRVSGEDLYERLEDAVRKLGFSPATVAKARKMLDGTWKPDDKPEDPLYVPEPKAKPKAK